jgi:hypothetical protein
LDKNLVHLCCNFARRIGDDPHRLRPAKSCLISRLFNNYIEPANLEIGSQILGEKSAP